MLVPIKKYNEPGFYNLCLIFVSLIFASGTIAEEQRRLNDTGINYGGHFPKGITDDCSASNGVLSDLARLDRTQFSQQQDCATGVSAIYQSSGASMFRYRKIDKEGGNLPLEAIQWRCVVDEVSGLVWEVKHSDSTKQDFHFADDKFTWYNSNSSINGGNIGDWNRSSGSCYGYDVNNPRTYCHIEQFVKRVNNKGLCGFNDWRMPTRTELTSLLHFGEAQPTIDSRYFPNTLNNFYWAKNPVVGREIEAWAVNFEFGSTSPLRKTDLRPTRLVRSVAD